MNLFKIKICGITNQHDATMAVEAGADAFGLNFYQKSLRGVTLDEAAKIETAPSVKRVGVFVNHSAQEIQDAVAKGSLDIVQLHGDESIEFATDFSALAILPVVRVKATGNERDVIQRVTEWANAGKHIVGVLLDAQVGKAYGGTGHTVDWDLAKKVVDVSTVPIVLAGGVGPDNVSEAIRAVAPFGVDVASGVEGLPGKKDHELVRAFVGNASFE